MSPKSRIYNLVMSWRNKPFRELRDIEQSAWQNTTSRDELGDLGGVDRLIHPKTPTEELTMNPSLTYRAVP